MNYSTRKCVRTFIDTLYISYHFWSPDNLSFQVSDVYQLYNMCHLACLSAALRPEHQQHHPSDDPQFAAELERGCTAGVPIRAQGAHRALQARKKHEGECHVPSQQKCFVSGITDSVSGNACHNAQWR